MSDESKIFCYCLTCEKGFARKKTYLNHFSASKNAKCKNAPTRISAKSKQELVNLKRFSVTSVKEHFQPKELYVELLETEDNQDIPSVSSISESEILKNQKIMLENQQKILLNQEKILKLSIGKK